MSLKRAIAAAAVSAATLSSAAWAADAPTVVLVHGAWANGSSWAEVIPLLQAGGLDVVAVHNPLSSFEADVAATRRVIDDQPGDVILVGHSYGGAVITEAGNSDKVQALVYVAAFAPSAGESLNAIVGSAPQPPQWLKLIHADARRLPFVAGRRDGEVSSRPTFSPEAAAVLAATQATGLRRRLRRQDHHAGLAVKPSWFVISDNDQIIPPPLQAAFADKMGANGIHVALEPCGHAVAAAGGGRRDFRGDRWHAVTVRMGTAATQVRREPRSGVLPGRSKAKGEGSP